MVRHRRGRTPERRPPPRKDAWRHGGLGWCEQRPAPPTHPSSALVAALGVLSHEPRLSMRNGCRATWFSSQRLPSSVAAYFVLRWPRRVAAPLALLSEVQRHDDMLFVDAPSNMSRDNGPLLSLALWLGCAALIHPEAHYVGKARRRCLAALAAARECAHEHAELAASAVGRLRRHVRGLPLAWRRPGARGMATWPGPAGVRVPRGGRRDARPCRPQAALQRDWPLQLRAWGLLLRVVDPGTAAGSAAAERVAHRRG